MRKERSTAMPNYSSRLKLLVMSLIMASTLTTVVSAIAAPAAPVTVAWDYPTNNTDGTPFIDAMAFELTARRCDAVQVSWTNISVRVSNLTITQKVVSAITWIPGPTQEVIRVAALTNCPGPGYTQAATFTNLTNLRVYRYTAVAINSWGNRSEDSEELIMATGTPAASAVKLKFAQ